MNNFQYYLGKVKAMFRNSWLKAILAFAVLLIALTIALAVLALAWSLFFGKSSVGYGSSFNTQAFISKAPYSGGVVSKRAAYAKPGIESLGMGAPMDSIEVLPNFDEGSSSNKAEDYEKVSYSAYYEDAEIDSKCKNIENLKPLDYVVFTYARRNKDSCNYNFWTDKAHEEEIVRKIKSLNPKEFNISTSSLERSVSSGDFEIKLLQEEIDELDETIQEAKKAYSELIALAKNRGKVTDLTLIIDNKIRLLERLQSKKRSLLTRLERLQRGNSETLDETQKVSFNVSLRKVEIVDLESIKESWREYTKSFIYNLNAYLKFFTYDLLLFAIKVLGFVVYLAVVLVILRLAYLLARKIWKLKRGRKLFKDKKDYKE